MNSPVAPTLDDFVATARDWLEAHATPRSSARGWGAGSDDVSVFRDLAPEAERAALRAAQQWQAAKHDAGFAAIGWPVEHGGAGLGADYEHAFTALERQFHTPDAHETLSVTVHLVAPTIRDFGTPEQRERFVQPFLRADELCCQLFSEPGAGSDLASLTTRSERDGDAWVVNGQKVWSSGAMFAEWGELIARTDRVGAKHAGLTAFLLPMDSPGVEVRPIRQMSGGASFAEVFLTDVRIPDSLRLGGVGDGWAVTLATLGYERATSGSANGKVGGSAAEAAALAAWLGRAGDPLARQSLASAYADDRLRQLVSTRARADGGGVGPAGSIGKLQWTEGMTRLSATVSQLLGPRLVADTGEWGTYAWSSHVLGAPGYRIAGGSDEIQRTIIGERILGLPREPRAAATDQGERS